MPGTLPTSNWSQSIDAVRTVFANVTAFQTWVNQPTVAGAKNRFYISSKPKTGLIYPCAIFIDRMLQYHTRTGGFIQDREGEIIFEMLNKDAVGTPDDLYVLTNSVDAIIEGVMDLAGIANTFGYLNDPEFSLITPPHWSEEGEQAAEGPLMACKFRITWDASR